MTEVFFELVRGHCNSNCSFCIFQAHKGFLKRSYFPLDRVDDFKRLNRGDDIYVSFVGFGELTLHKNWVEIIKSLGEQFTLNTLMTNFCKRMSDEEIELAAKFNKIQIEIGAIDEKTKRLSLRRGKDFVDENVRRLRDAGANPYLKIVRTKINKNSLEGFDVDEAEIYSKENMQYFNKDFDYEKYYDEIVIEDIPANDQCGYAKYDAPLLITTTGDAMLCYIIPYNSEEEIKKHSCGNVFKQSIKDILSSERFKYLRERQLNKKYFDGYCQFCKAR